MRRLSNIVLLLFVISGCGAGERFSASASALQVNELKVLFIGNSHTYLAGIGTTLPRVIQKMAATRGRKLNWTKRTSPRRTLEKAYSKSRVRNAVARGGWDYVVLQEQATRPLDLVPGERQLFFEAVRNFDRDIKAVGASTILYVIWARKEALDTQDELNAVHQAIASEVGALIVPVGSAWARVREEHPSLVLHQNDDYSHANKQGAYLSACLFYAILFQDDPVGLPHKGVGFTIDAGQAAILQLVARDIAAGH